nr:PKD domain-containing protein [Bacteroidota bacterium]
MKRIVTIIAISFSFLLFFQDRLIAQNEILYPTEVIEAAYFDVTPPLRDMMVIEPGIRTREWKNNVVKNHMGFMEDIKNIPQLNGPDPVLQMKDGEKSTRSIGVNINGVGNLSGVAPPDTDGDVGPNHYFQMVNLAFAIYDKSGTLLYGPVDNSTLWSGFIGSWTGTNDGDPIILYDSYSDRWMATQFAINTGDGTQWELVAISQTGDPTGSWYRYAFQFTYMPDYPKFGIWPDGYYLSINQFQKIGSSYYWKGGGACVLNRDKMIAGDPTAEMVFFNLGTSYGSLLPADADGTLPPPTGTPNYFTRFTSGKLQLWELGVDWANTSNSTITRKPDISIASFSNSGFTINQPGTSTSLDDLADRLMYRLQYRNFGTHQAMVTNHTVNNGSNKAAVRWYEMRKTGTSWSLYQQGTYNPNDGNHRWMGSIAMNASGDIALGYSVSGSSTYPSIRFTGRNNGDPLGTMTIAETSIFSGTHSQTGVSRWGDYSCMSVDPINDQTFWFTTEYSNGGWSWKTRIASFDISETVVPIISVTPGSFDETLKLGQSSNQQMTVKNSGEGTLNFSTQIDYLSTGTGWLSVAPSSGSLSTGQTQICTVTFNTSTLSIGSYSAEINVTSNDPMNPLITIPVSLTVYSTTPAIVVNPVSIDFGQVIPGNTIQSSYTVTNAGNETLEIFNTVSNNTVFSANPVYFSIDPSEQQIVNVSFFPSNVGVVSGALTIYSNDPTQPQVQVQLTGEGFLPTPQNLDANVQGFDVNLSWNAPPGIGRQMLGYNVYRNNNILNTTLVTELFYEDTDVDGGIYDYKVSAVYDEGESLKAGPVTVTVGSPHIAINPLSFAEGLFPDETSTQVLQIQNTGELDLSVDLQLEYVVEKIGEPVAIDPEIYSGQLNQRTNEFGHEINYTPLDPVDGYCIPSADCSYGDGFTDFEMSEINNAGSGCSPNGYGDFTNMTADLIAGQAYNVTFRSGYSRQYVCLWIDFDNNDTFDESERLLTDFYLPNKNQYYTAQIVIPSEIATGENRLRVRANWLNSSSDPCADFNYGETEDYTVNITGAQVQWLSLDPVAVSIPSGQTVDINVIMNTIDLEIGTYYASILIYSNDPDNPFIEVPVSLEVLNLLADFEADNTQIMAGESVNFTDLSHGTPTSWEWAFDGGEPTTSGDQNPAGVTYNTPGTFDVSLTVTNDNGTDTETKTSYITVSEPPIPVADFDAGSTTIFAGESIGFTDLTTNGPTSWSWQFPGAEPQTSLVQNPTAITYNSPGIYDVTLSVDNAYGSDTETKFDYITVEALPVPEADFTVSSTIVFAGESIDFYD